MANIPQPIPANPLGVWATEITKVVRSQEAGQSPDSLRQIHGGGTLHKSKAVNKINPLIRQVPVPYDQDEAYGVGDEVYNTNAIQIADTSFSTSPLIPAGIWLCLQNVPSNKFQNRPDIQALGPEYFRWSDINYYPRWPISDEELIFEQVYWLPLFFFPVQMNVCNDGVSKTWWICGIPPSGSVSS